MGSSKSNLSALLLTSTLRPSNAVHGLKRANWQLRESDYLWSAQKWGDAGYTAWDRAWLVDNSPVMAPEDWAAFDLKLRNRSAGFIAPIQVPATDDAQVGPVQKGRGEAQLLDLGVAELAEQGVAYFSKVTGRLFVSNVDHIFKAQRRDGISASISSRLDMSDTRFFSMPVKIWLDHYGGIASEVDEVQGILFEHVFARRTLTAIAAGEKFYGMHKIPRFMGASASMNIEYGTLRTRLNRSMHELARMPIRRRQTGLIL